MMVDARPQPLTVLTPAAPAYELAACEGDTCLVPYPGAPAVSTTQE